MQALALRRIEGDEPIRLGHVELVEVRRIPSRRALDPRPRGGLGLRLIERHQRPAAAVAGEDDRFHAPAPEELDPRRDVQHQLLVNAGPIQRSGAHPERREPALSERLQREMRDVPTARVHEHEPDGRLSADRRVIRGIQTAAVLGS